MKNLVSICLTTAIAAGLAIPTVAAQNQSSEPTAMERLMRQENAGAAQLRRSTSSAPTTDASDRAVLPTASRPQVAVEPGQPTAIERLLRQEDARHRDTRLGIQATVQSGPTLRVVTRNDFDWLDAAVGAAAGMAVMLAIGGASIIARTRRPQHA